MLRKVLVAVALLSVSATSVSAYAADGVIGRGSPAVSKASNGKKKGLLIVALGAAAGVGVAVAASGGGNGDSPD